MLSPSELKNKQIEPKKKRYYDKTEMDQFLDEVYTNYRELYERNMDLKKKVKTLSDGIQYYNSIETTLKQALILAEKTSKETKDAAILKAEAIEKEATIKADEIINNAEKEYLNIKQQCVHLVQQFNQYKLQLKQAASAQIELIDSDTFDIYSPELNALYKDQVKEIESQEDIVTESDTSLVTPPEEIKDPILVFEEAPPLEPFEIEQPKMELKDNSSAAVIKEAEPINAKVLDVMDADTKPLEPLPLDNLKEPPIEPVKIEKEETQTLDSLLKDLNMSTKKTQSSSKNKSPADNDPFDFLGDIEDF